MRFRRRRDSGKLQSTPQVGELKAAVERLRQTNSELEQKYLQATAELKALRDRASDAEGSNREKVRQTYFDGGTDKFPTYPQVIIDPIYGSVDIDNRFAPIYKHPLVQRLDS